MSWEWHFCDEYHMKWLAETLRVGYEAQVIGNAAASPLAGGRDEAWGTRDRRAAGRWLSSNFRMAWVALK